MKSRKYHIIIATILFAILMWISINMTYEYTIVLPVPIQVENLPSDKALKKPIPKTLNVRLKGIGWNLSAMKIAGDIRFTIDISKLPNYSVINTDQEVFHNLKLPSEITPIDAYPDSIIVALDKTIEKKVKIISDVILNFRDGYGQVGESDLIPDSIILEGAKSYLDTLDQWKSKSYVFNEIGEPFNTKLELTEPPEYIFRLHQKDLNYKVNVQPFAEKTLSGINIQVNSVPLNREVVLIPPKIDIIIRGSIQQLVDISNENILTWIDYNNLLADSSGYVQPEIEIPDGIRIVRKQPEQFQYIIRKRLQ